MHAVCLERLFRSAYLTRDPEPSKTRYLATIPKGIAKQFTMARTFGLAVHDAELTWSNLLAVASRMDAEYGYASTDMEPDDPEIWAFSSATMGRPSSLGSPREGTQPIAGYPRESPSSILKSAHAGSSVPYGGSDVMRPPQGNSATSGVRACHHCDRAGHVKADCRRFNGLCLVCGSSSHLIADCPVRRVSMGESFPVGARAPVGGSGVPSSPRGGSSTRNYRGEDRSVRVTFEESPSEGQDVKSAPALNFRAPAGQGASRRS